MRLTTRQRARLLVGASFQGLDQQHHGALREMFAPHVPFDGIVIDAGAHSGQFSKLFARMAPAGHVYAFEPSVYARSIMAPALRLNRVRNVTLTPEALSDSVGRLTLRTPLKRSSALGYGIAHLGFDKRR